MIVRPVCARCSNTPALCRFCPRRKARTCSSSRVLAGRGALVRRLLRQRPHADEDAGRPRSGVPPVHPAVRRSRQPVDITGGEPPKTYQNTVRLGLEDDRIHSLILGYWHTIVTPPMVFAEKMVDVVAECAKGIDKPIVASLVGDTDVERGPVSTFMTTASSPTLTRQRHPSKCWALSTSGRAPLGLL